MPSAPWESEEQYRSLFENDLTGNYIAGPTGEIWLCNPAFAEIFGFSSPQAARGCRLASLHADPKSWPAFIRRLNYSKRLLRLERSGRRRDGTPLHLVETVVGAFNRRGRLMQIQGYVFDDTERKQAAEELQQFSAMLERRVATRTEELSAAYDRLRAITDNAPIGILTVNERGLINTLNPAAAAIFGCSPPQMQGRNIREFMASQDHCKGEALLSPYPQAGHQRFFSTGREVPGRRKEGHDIVLELTVSDFTYGGRRQFVVMVRDISARKRLERELLEVGERERQRLGHDLHDGLGQHLHALYYMASLLEKEMRAAAPERAREAGRLARELEHALELSRSLARGLQPVNAVPEGLMVALRELAGRTRALYRVDCRFQCRKSVLIHRHSTANHLYRIAQEAVNNAMKHGKPTRIRILLTASPWRIVLGIRDNGVGIRPQTGRVRGMGLHLMQYRAEALRGSLLVQRSPRGGTEVVCTAARTALLPMEENRN